MAQKQLTKTESLVFSSKTSSTSDDEIFNVHRLLLAQKPLTNNRTRGPKKSSNKPSSTADPHILSAQRLLMAQKQLTKTEPLVFQKSSSKTSSTSDDEIFNVHRLLLAQKPLTNTRTRGPKHHPISPVLRLTLTS
jgi:hypothetical protein